MGAVISFVTPALSMTPARIPPLRPHAIERLNLLSIAAQCIPTVFLSDQRSFHPKIFIFILVSQHFVGLYYGHWGQDSCRASRRIIFGIVHTITDERPNMQNDFSPETDISTILSQFRHPSLSNPVFNVKKRKQKPGTGVIVYINIEYHFKGILTIRLFPNFLLNC